MARYIDADRLIDDGWMLERHGISNKLLQVMSIADVPTADVVEVVRCKDCKKHGSRECIVNRKMDIMGHPTTTKANSFCSYGERRDT